MYWEVLDCISRVYGLIESRRITYSESSHSELKESKESIAKEKFITYCSSISITGAAGNTAEK